MNKSVLKNGNIYPPFLESGPMPPAPRLAWRNPQGVLPVSAVPRFAIASSVDTHAHVFERGLPMPDARRYAPDEDAHPAWAGHARRHGRGLPMPDARRYAPDEDALLGPHLPPLATHAI